jgi:hypothetical protein
MNKVIVENDNNSLGNTSNSDNPNENGKRRKSTRNRLTKNKRYEKERKELIKELEGLMGLENERHGILLYDLEHNDELKMYLKNKIPEIKKMFCTGMWNYFVKQHVKEDTELSEISLLKCIFKEEKYKITNRRRLTEREGIKKIYIELYFHKE